MIIRRRPRLLLFVLLCALLLTEALAGGYALRTVRSGDTLASIAATYGISAESLAAFNDIQGTTIHPGDVLRVPYIEAVGGVAEAAPKPPPGFRLHTLQNGETISSLQNRYGLSLDAIVGANPDISSLDRLPTGLELLIPPSEGLVVMLDHDMEVLDLVRIYGISAAEIARANRITSPDDLHPGKLLFLPGVPAVAALDRLANVREEENRYVWPLHGRLTSFFGRRNLGMGTSSFHRGLDIAAPPGTPVRAARSGTVIFAGWSNRGYGNLVKIRHAGGAETWYAHHSRILVRVGESVRQGEVIALVGSTGISTGPHLHFELHENGTAVDPMAYLR